jgi:hypothetical protein
MTVQNKVQIVCALGLDMGVCVCVCVCVYYWIVRDEMTHAWQSIVA